MVISQLLLLCSSISEIQLHPEVSDIHSWWLSRDLLRANIRHNLPIWPSSKVQSVFSQEKEFGSPGRQTNVVSFFGWWHTTGVGRPIHSLGGICHTRSFARYVIKRRKLSTTYSRPTCLHGNSGTHFCSGFGLQILHRNRRTMTLRVDVSVHQL